TTSYSVFAFDVNLTGATLGNQVLISMSALGGSGAGPLDIAWIAIRPWFHDVLTDGNVEVGDVSGGIILKSPDGTRYIAKIANGGTWTIGAA
ncbi:MAG TPA: hypothetical protein VII01_07270, partial [Solirubrobacteraceae bacterium]